jgi:hypothetical protein
MRVQWGGRIDDGGRDRLHTSTPTESASSLTDLPFTRDLLVVLGASVATESMEVSPSRFGPGTASASDGIDMVVSPAEVDEVDFRGMVGLLVELGAVQDWRSWGGRALRWRRQDRIKRNGL